MNPTRFLALCLFTLLGCHDELVPISDGGGPSVDGMKCPAQPDLAAPAAKCAAAKGLSGDNLLCVDFDAVSGPSDPKLAGWNFAALTSAGCPGWTVSNGKLQVITGSFPGFAGTCAFSMPAVNAGDYAKYTSFTLSVVQTLDISDANDQKALVYNGTDISARLLDRATSRLPRKQLVQTIAKTVMPISGAGMFQPFYKLEANLAAGGNAQGWLFESIAINGIQ